MHVGLTISAYAALLNVTFEERRGLWVKATASNSLPLTVPANLRATPIIGPSDLQNFENWILKYDAALTPGPYEQRMRSARLPKLRRARLNFHHICGTDVDTSANASARCNVVLEMADGHFYQFDASRKFFDFAIDDPDKVKS